MNLFVENNGPYVYRSIFRETPRLRPRWAAAKHTRTQKCHACGASLDEQDYSASPTNPPGGPEPQPEPELQPDLQSEPESESEPGPEAELHSESEPEPELDLDLDPDQPAVDPQQQQSAYDAPSAAVPDPRYFVPTARVLEVFEFLFNTVADALVHQPGTLNRIRRAFEEGLASAVDP